MSPCDINGGVLYAKFRPLNRFNSCKCQVVESVQNVFEAAKFKTGKECERKLISKVTHSDMCCFPIKEEPLRLDQLCRRRTVRLKLLSYVNIMKTSQRSFSAGRQGVDSFYLLVVTRRQFPSHPVRECHLPVKKVPPQVLIYSNYEAAF